MSGLLAHLCPLFPRAGVLAALLFASLANTGCAASDGMIEKLYDSTRDYNGSLRWGDWDRAADYIPRASATAFLDSHQAVEEKLVVIDYEMTRIEIDKPNGIASSQVDISWHTDDNLVVRTTRVNHVWQWYEGQWLLVDERRSSGKPLAIFAEIDEDEAHPYLPGLEAFREEYAIGLDADEKRKRERDQRKAAKARADDPSQKYSLDELESMPVKQRPASFN